MIKLIHGFNVSDGGEGTIGTLRPYLTESGFRSSMFTYGRIGMIRARASWPVIKTARRLAAETSPGDVLIGHSHGCNIANEAVFQGAEVETMIWINPALDVDVPVHRKIRRVIVCYWPGDLAVTLASHLILHRWGKLGATGYKGERTDGCQSLNSSEIIRARDPEGREKKDKKAIFRHSRFAKRFSIVGPFLAEALQEALKKD